MPLACSSFVGAKPGSREFNAVARALTLKPTIRPIGKYKDEKYYRVQAKDRPFHCVTTFKDMHGIRQARCDCEAHTIYMVPCFHAAAAVIEESQPRKHVKKRKT